MSKDNELKQAVLTELNWEPSVTAAHIGVTAKSGVVTLMGHVGSYAEKRAAETAASRVNGVKAVAEEIEVRLPFDVKRADDDIASAALERLSWDVSVPVDAVKVKVENGWLTLSGQVDWHFQKDAAEQEVRGLSGVVGVANKIAIKSVLDTSKIGDDIMHALHRSWLFDAKTIKVSADGGKIRLTGSVRTPYESQVAMATAWSAPGAISVQNDLAVI